MYNAGAVAQGAWRQDSRLSIAMWLGELIVLVCFFGLGAALTPTAFPDAYARKTGNDAWFRQRRDVIDRSRADYRARNPQSQQVFKVGVGVLVAGFAMVMLWNIPGNDGYLSSGAGLVVSLGWILQVIALPVILGTIVLERRYIVDALRQAGVRRNRTPR
jgi:hypothetical protein